MVNATALGPVGQGYDPRPPCLNWYLLREGRGRDWFFRRLVPARGQWPLWLRLAMNDLPFGHGGFISRMHGTTSRRQLVVAAKFVVVPVLRRRKNEIDDYRGVDRRRIRAVFRRVSNRLG